MKAPQTIDDKEFYKMDHKFRGKAIIFNHIDFSDDMGGDDMHREGSKKDAEDLAKVLKGLGFEVDMYIDYTSEQTKKKLENVARNKKRENADSDCVLVVVLSHGDDKNQLAAYDKWYLDEELWNPFLAENCPSLRGKPKLFFLNACRGLKRDMGVLTDNKPDNKKAEKITLPNHADFLIARSTPPGFVSYRNTTEGSHFIQALCEVLDPDKGAFDNDLLSLLVKAQGIVASKEMGERYKQMPSFTCQLTKKMLMKDNKEKDS